MRRMKPQEDPSCIIVGAGVNDVVPRTPRAQQDCLIAADGGLDFLRAHTLTPDIVVGDFDSVSATPLSSDSPTSTVISLPAEKDDTDMTSAVKVGWERKYSLFHIYGGLGGRIDHTIANLQLLVSIAEHGGMGFLHSSENVITAISEAQLHFSAESATPAEMVSVFAFSDTAQHVCLHGLKYEVSDGQFRNTLPLGVSNEFTGRPATIGVGTGSLIVTLPQNSLPESVELKRSRAQSFGTLTTHVSSLLAL